MGRVNAASPDDLAVAFRSFARRAREAQGDAPRSAVAAPLAEIDRHVAAAARLLRCAPAPDLVADAIEHQPADAWSDADLDTLRDSALQIGALVRRIERLAGADD
jgi:hypothetical protein